MAALTHKDIVSVHSKMGYIEVNVYPNANITIMRSKHDGEFMTITGSSWKKGYHDKFEEEKTEINKQNEEGKMNENIKTTAEEESKDVNTENKGGFTITHGGVTSTDGIGKLSLALAKAQGSFDPVTKDKVNPHFKSSFASIDSILKSTRVHLSNNELILMQFLSGDQNTVIIISRIMHSSGQWIQSEVSCKTERNTAQGLGSVTSYMRRYAMAALLNISADEDEDGNAASFIDKNQISSIERMLENYPEVRRKMIAEYKEFKLMPADLYLENIEKINKNIKYIDDKRLADKQKG